LHALDRRSGLADASRLEQTEHARDVTVVQRGLEADVLRHGERLVDEGQPLGHPARPREHDAAVEQRQRQRDRVARRRAIARASALVAWPREVREVERLGRHGERHRA
jgi:hypothetical protein